MVLAENGPSVQVQPSSNAQLLSDQNVDSALSLEITVTVLEAADDGCTSAQAFRCMVYDGIDIDIVNSAYNVPYIHYLLNGLTLH